MIQSAHGDWARLAPGAMTSASDGRTRSALKGLIAAGTAVLVITTFGTASAASLPPETFADLAAKVTPAVVNVSSTQHLAGAAGDQGDQAMPFDFPPGSPFEQFFKQFHDRKLQHGEDVKALGSGFIVDPAGYIVTNNHVIDHSTDIHVTLSDGKDLPAKLIGTDTKTDLALLKVEYSKPLPFVSFGDSNASRVGDWVLAVGNPFGLGGTVTTGIISARGRDLHDGPFDDFLQIDASINKGNSGGPTFNLAGDVIGVNTAIASPNGGSVGIGFAIPSNLAKPVIDELRKTGRVERGWIGVGIQSVTPEIASSLGLGDPTGSLVASVQPKGPAAAGGIQQGDVILTFDGQTVHETRELPRIVAETPAGKTVDVEVWRDGARKTVSLTVAQMKNETQVASADESGGDQSPTGVANQVLGVQLATLTNDMRQQLGLADDVKGVVVTDIDQQGAAAQQGLRQGDVIEEVARKPVANPEEVDQIVQRAVTSKKPAVLLLVNRQGNEVFLAVKVGKA
jgi:serine protease Do